MAKDQQHTRQTPNKTIRAVRETLIDFHVPSPLAAEITSGFVISDIAISSFFGLMTGNVTIGESHFRVKQIVFLGGIKKPWPNGFSANDKQKPRPVSKRHENLSSWRPRLPNRRANGNGLASVA